MVVGLAYDEQEETIDEPWAVNGAGLSVADITTIMEELTAIRAEVAQIHHSVKTDHGSVEELRATVSALKSERDRTAGVNSVLKWLAGALLSAALAASAWSVSKGFLAEANAEDIRELKRDQRIEARRKADQ